MRVQTIPQTSATTRRSIVRSSWPVVLGIVIVVAMLAVYRLSSMPAAAALNRNHGQSSLVDPAAQSVLAYLRAHSGVRPALTAAPLDAAQQSVMKYVRAHATAEPFPVLWDQAAQAVLDYLRVHGR